METETSNPPVEHNFFGLDKENGKYYITPYGDISLIILKGDDDFLRKATNMFSLAGCKAISREDHDIVHISMTPERLKKGFELQFYFSLYMSDFAKKKDIYELDEETKEECWTDCILLNQKELDIECQRLSDLFIQLHVLPALPGMSPRYEKYTNTAIMGEYTFRQVNNRLELKEKNEMEDGDKFLRLAFERGKIDRNLWWAAE